VEEEAAAAIARWCGVDGCVATATVVGDGHRWCAAVLVLPKHLVREFGL
jgi:hypothetical protein